MNKIEKMKYNSGYILMSYYLTLFNLSYNLKKIINKTLFLMDKYEIQL